MISFQDLGILIIFVLLLGICIYALLIFNNLNAILKNIRFLQTKHLDDFDHSLSMLPSIVENIDLAAFQVREGVERVTEAVDEVGDTISSTVTSVSTGTREAAEYIKIIGEIVSVIISQFRK